MQVDCNIKMQLGGSTQVPSSGQWLMTVWT